MKIIIINFSNMPEVFCGRIGHAIKKHTVTKIAELLALAARRAQLLGRQAVQQD